MVSPESEAFLHSIPETNRKPLKKVIRDKAISSPLGRAAIRKVIPWVCESGTDSFFELSGEENIFQLAPYLQENRTLVMVADHESQGDAAGAVRVAKKIMDKFPSELEGFNYMIAKSMESGDQGIVVKTIFSEGVYPWMRKNNIEPIATLSDNDIEDRKMEHESSSVLHVVRSIKRQKRGVIIHPQATVKAGNINEETGERYGMGEMSKRGKEFFTLLEKLKIKAVVLPVGIHGYFEFFDSKGKNFTKEGIEMMSSNLVYRIGGISMSEPVGSVRIGRPQPLEHYMNQEDPFNAMMYDVSRLVPDKARGIYK